MKYTISTISGVHTQIARNTNIVGYTEGVLEVFLPETVCQFTGLLDKNGVEIYEGDVLKSEMYGSGVVRWEKDKTEFVVIDGRDRYFVLTFGVVTKNIHDNPSNK